MIKKQLFLKVAICFIAILLATNNGFAEMRNSITQYGITWTFNGSYECGQFISGDWWVVGPVTINSVSPAPANRMNGSVVNPKDENFKQGYDGRYTPNSDYPDACYNASLRASFPLTLSGVNSLVSTKSNTSGQNCTYSGTIMGWMNEIGDCQRGYLKSMAVLTVVDTPVPAGTFRPSYIGSTNKEFIHVSQIDYNVLPSLPAPASLPDINRVLRLFERPWLDHYGGWITQFLHAIDNAEGYGREMSNDVTEAAMYLMTDGAQKDELTRRMVQRAIDIYGGLLNGVIWPPDGGHASGRKWPVLFAGKVLNHQGMLNIGNTYGHAFGEDQQTYYVNGNVNDPWWRFGPGREGYKMNYRTCCTSRTWVGQVLATYMLHLEDEWNNQVYFDYIERFVAQDIPTDYSYWGGNDGGTFVHDMWTTYRNNLPAEIPYGGGGATDSIAPSVPGTPSASNITHNSVDLSWTASTDDVGISGYKIYTGGVYTKTVTGTSTTMSGLSAETLYSFTVSAYDAATNESAQSASASATTLQAPATVPVNETIQGEDYSAVSGCSNATNQTGYTGTGFLDYGGINTWGEWTTTMSGSGTITLSLRYANGLAPSRPCAVTVNGVSQGSTTFATTSTWTNWTTETISIPVEEGTNTIRITATTSNGGPNLDKLDLTGEVGGGGPDTEAPSVPSGLASSNITTTTVDLSWSASTDNVGVTGYKVYTYGSNPITVTGTSTTISGLTASTPYTFSVSAIDAAGNESAESASEQVTTNDPPDTEAPSVPSGLASSNITTTSVDLSWSASTDNIEVTGYKVYTNGANPVTVTSTSTTISSLTPSTQYSFTVSAIDEAGNESAQSGAEVITTATPIDTEAPSVPAGLASSNITTSTVDLSWSASTDNVGVAGYKVYTDGANPVTVTGTSTTISGLTASTQYSFTVSAYDAASNESAQSGAEVVTTNDPPDTEAPSVPGGLASSNITSSSVDLSWSASTDNVGVTGYKVYTDGANPVTVGGTSTTISGLSSSTQYSFTVSAYDAASNESAQSSAEVVTTDVSTSVTVDETIQAEDYSNQSGCSVATNNAGYTGTGFFDFGGNGTWGEWTYTSPGEGTITLAVTYANGVAVNRQCALTVNGAPVGNLTFSPTGAWTTWVSSSISIDLIEGTNTIRLTANTSNGGPNVDKLDLDGTVGGGGPDTQAPSTPGAPSASNITTTSVDLSWSASTDNVGVTGYKVYTNGSNPVSIAGTSTTISGLSASTTYNFTVSAVDAAANESSQSSSTPVTTNDPPDTQAPSVPGTPVSSNITHNSVDLSWSASTDNVGVTGYKVYTNGANPVTLAGTSTTISGLSAETQYSFTVSAFDAASNESAQSSAEVVTTAAAPGGVNLIVNGEFDNGTTNWVAGNYAGTASLSAVTGQGMSGTNAMQISISAAGTNIWDIQIYQDMSIESGKTYEISFMAKAASNRTMAAVIQNTDSPYEEYWRADVSLTTSNQTFGPYTFNCGVTDATSRFKFFVAGNASTIYVDNIIVNDVTSSSGAVEFVQSNASFRAYPNPLRGNELTLSLSGYNSENVNVVITDIMGRIAYSEILTIGNNTTASVNTNLTGGLYIISVNGKNVFIQQKLIVE